MELFRNRSTDPTPGKPDRTDKSIRQDILTLFKRDDYLRDRDIKVSVKKGVVDLEGKVSTQQSWQLAGDLAADVSGVREINNHIQVVPGPGNPVR